MRDWYQRNPDQLRRQNERVKARYAVDPEPTKARVKAWRQLNPEAVRTSRAAWRERNRERERIKNAARMRVLRAIKAGKVLRPAACEFCGSVGATQAHHEDYSRPLDVTFLCRDCHGATWRVA